MSVTIENPFKRRLLAGDIMYGIWFGLANNIAAEICAQSEFDWLLIDAEHSPLSDHDILSCLQALAPYNITPVVRPVSGDDVVLKRLTDIGVQNFLIPMVNDADEAAAIVSSVMYPPTGTRGLGTSMARAARWNMIPNYIQVANEEMCVIIQVETIAALENLEKIALTDGVSAIFIGPSDLGAALGYPGQPSHREVVKAVSHALRSAKKLGKPVGVLAVDPEVADHYLDCGASFVGVGSDCGILARGVAQLATSFHSGGKIKGDY